MMGTVGDKATLVKRARDRYELGIRPQVETPENIGKVLIIEPESGDFEMSEDGLEANHRMLAKHPGATLVGLRIGHDVVEQFGAYLPASTKA